MFDQFLHVGGAATGLLYECGPIGEDGADVRFDFESGCAGFDRVGDDAIHWPEQCFAAWDCDRGELEFAV